jgi:seryl-tRNA synthetase
MRYQCPAVTPKDRPMTTCEVMMSHKCLVKVEFPLLEWPSEAARQRWELRAKDALDWLAKSCERIHARGKELSENLPQIGNDVKERSRQYQARNEAQQTAAKEIKALAAEVEKARQSVWEMQQSLERALRKVPAQVLPNSPTPTQSISNQTPRWDEDVRRLFLGNTVLKKFNRNAAKNQLDIIEAFHRAGWPSAIDDPFRDPRKLNQTLADLNRSLPQPDSTHPGHTVRFRGDGTGERVYWELC